MQQRQSTAREVREQAGPFAPLPSQEKQRAARRGGSRNFVHWDAEKQREAFFAWLPKELHDAPGVDWGQIAPEIMGYCIYTIGNSLDSAVLAVAAASLHRAVDLSSQISRFHEVNMLLRELRATGLIHSLEDLKQGQTWDQWARVSRPVS